MSYLLSHLQTGWAVDQAILTEESKVVLVRFGHDWDGSCMEMDEVLCRIAEDVKNFCSIYVVDITQVPVAMAGGCDFVISTDVFEHVCPPVSRAFDGARRRTNCQRCSRAGGLEPRHCRLLRHPGGIAQL